MPLLKRPGVVATKAEQTDGGAENPQLAVEEFMLREFYPWVRTSDDCKKCLDFLRSKEKLEFDVDKAQQVMSSLRESHYERYRERLPFELPKSWPGMQLVLQRCSTPIV